MTEISRPLLRRNIPPEGLEVTVQASPAERVALAGRLDVPAIAALAGVFHLRLEPGKAVAAKLKLTAEVTRISVISLEPFTAHVTDHARLRFVPENDELEIDIADPEAPDEIPFSGDTLDLGDVLAEQLALALDPYPRQLGEMLQTSEPEARDASVFAMLAPGHQKRPAG